MRKTLVAIIAAGAVGAAWADASVQQQQYQDQFRERPEARAYLSYSFGGNDKARNLAAPLHYGLRVDHGSREQRDSGVLTTPLLQLDHDNRGETLASASGLPFAGRNLRLHQSDDGSGSSTSGGSSNGGWSFFDWTLLAVGIGGAGYLIYHATEGHDSPNATKSTGSGSTTGGTTGGSTGGSTGGLLGGILLTDAQAGSDALRDFDNQRWLDGGTGHMGDLGGR